VAGLKSVQYGVITIPNGSASNTAVISSVDITKSVIERQGQTTDIGAGLQDSFARLSFNDQTSVTATRQGNANQLLVRFCVKEYN
jgi:hypothetical protein